MKFSFTKFLMLAAVVAAVACYHGDPGYGLCQPGDDSCTENAKKAPRGPVHGTTIRYVAYVPSTPGVAAVTAGAPTVLSAVSPGASGNVLTSNGTDWTSAVSAAVPTNLQWWQSPDRGLAQGTDAGGEGYPYGLVFRFISAATITGIRFYCTNGGVQDFTIHCASAVEPGAGQTQTLVQSKTCTGLTPGIINTCNFDTPITISDLTKVYTASVIGSSNVAHCTQINGTPYNTGVGAGATTPVGPNVWLEANGSVFGTFNSSTSLPSSSDNARLATVAFVFTVP